ncbi:NusA-like protein [Legionella lansingensis]|uniref:Ribosome maturation factor RimP n=1 Tax=Legionella lansingensis TaxID=45067 RepID=A0A0W0VRC8_9GAMM|nr:ribosome maturation factor RimP [Legionella lansingensis]KTD22688.1 Ribosome maturation factor RimP [Legionella lansingensis]SNV55596.1 NusA-like protein [Legionella lansingensis]
MIKNEIEQLLKPLIEDLGYELWGCEYLPQGKHSLLRIYIDKEDGIHIEDCERVSRQVSALLDVEDPIPGNYSLEVSSPGIPRPLFNKEQYRRYIGQDIRLKLFKPINGSRNLSGTIVSVNDDILILKIGDEQLEVQFTQIVKANLTGE